MARQRMRPGAAPTGPSAAPVLELRNVSKQFGATRALDAVDLTLFPGEITGLLGQNGSGKSTLVKVMAGAHSPEAGATVRFRGEEKAFPLRREEMRLGVVAQDLGLVEKVTVLENLNIGRRIASASRARFGINWRAERRRAQALLAIVRCAQDIAGQQDADAEGSVMILDEPTVFLPEHEQEFLFDLVRRSARDGTSVVIISHDLAVIRELAGRAVVLRNGRLAADVRMADVTDRDLVDLIVGYTPERDETPAGPGGQP